MTAFRVEDLPPELASRIKVNPVSGCWEWTGNLTPAGYGVRRHEVTHRTVYKLLVGPIEDGINLDHVQERGCRSKACCWPAHLEPVTHAENSRRAQEWAIRRRREAIAQMAAESGTRAVPAAQAYQSLDRLLDAVHDGERLMILRYQTPAAVIVPVEWHEAALEAIEAREAEDAGNAG